MTTIDQYNFTVSYLDTNGDKHDKEVYLDRKDYQNHCAHNYSVLLQNYPKDQAEKHILATKRDYIHDTLVAQFGENTPLEYDVAEMINTLDRGGKGPL